MFCSAECDFMLARCTNENCKRPLHSFAEGRLFQFEVISISLAASDEKSAPFDEKPQRETLHFWLCGRCASKMTLVLEPARGLRLMSLDERNPNAAEDLEHLPPEKLAADIHAKEERILGIASKIRSLLEAKK